MSAPSYRQQPRSGGLGGAWLASYLYRALAAALLAAPVVVTLGGSGIRNFPEGDAKLFEPGALYLLEVLLHERAALSEAVAPSLVLGLALALASLVPERLLLAAVWRRATPAVAPLEARRALPRLLALGLATWVLRLVLVVAAVALAATLRSYAASARDERWPLLLTSAVVLLGLLTQGAVSVLRDVAMLEVVGHGASVGRAVRSAALAARRSGARLASAYAAATIASAGLLAATLFAASGLDLASGGSLPSLGALLLQQLAIAGTIGLHAAWLCAARRALEAAPPEGASGRSVLVDLEVTPRGGLPAQVEAQQAPGEARPGGVAEGREPTGDRTE
jgi:hypothetical protein